MTTLPTIFNYNNSPISFQKGENIMINATEMAKPFGKRPVDWIKNASTQAFLAELSNVRNLTFEKLTITRDGAPSNGGGTWMHEDVALEFARWLSPSFAIWCNDRIKELLTTGSTSLQPLNFDDPEAVLLLATKWNEEKKLRLQAEAQARAEAEINEANRPKVAFANAMLAGQNSCLVGELAKIISQNGYTIGQNRLFQWLRDKGYLGRAGEYYNIPNQRYIEQGLFEVKRSTRSGSGGELYNISTTKVTPKGQGYFIQKFIGA